MTGRRITVAICGLTVALALGAAQRPAALAGAAGGVWEVSGAPGASAPLKQCLADPAMLAQFEHRGKACNRTVISDNGNTTVIHYTCPGGGFGQSKLTLITPRSLRVETQGISDNLPFNYTLQARRTGDCPPR